MLQIIEGNIPKTDRLERDVSVVNHLNTVASSTDADFGVELQNNFAAYKGRTDSVIKVLPDNASTEEVLDIVVADQEFAYGVLSFYADYSAYNRIDHLLPFKGHINALRETFLHATLPARVDIGKANYGRTEILALTDTLDISYTAREKELFEALGMLCDFEGVVVFTPPTEAFQQAIDFAAEQASTPDARLVISRQLL